MPCWRDATSDGLIEQAGDLALLLFPHVGEIFFIFPLAGEKKIWYDIAV